MLVTGPSFPSAEKGSTGGEAVPHAPRLYEYVLRTKIAPPGQPTGLTVIASALE